MTLAHPARRRLLARAAAALALAALTRPAAAQTVFCSNCSTVATQLLQQAAQAEQLINSAAQLEQQIKGYLNMLQNTASLPARVVGDVRADVDRVRAVWADARAVAYTSKTLSADFAGRYRSLADYRAQGLSTDGLSAKFDQWNGDTRDTVLRTFQALGLQADSVTSDAERFDVLKQHLATSDGQKQALDVLGEMTAELVQQNLKLRELILAQVQLTAQDVQTRNDQAAAGEAAVEGLMNVVKAARGTRR